MSDAALALFASVAGIPRPNLDDPAIAEFADQFALDVSSMDDAQRTAFFAAAGDQAFAVAQRIYAHDLVPRVRACWARSCPACHCPRTRRTTGTPGRCWRPS